VYDRKTVRRRRAVLGLLVAASLILVTASFGDGLRSIERGALEVLGPIQEGASSVLKPVRDAAGWVGDTLDAKGENEDLREERDELRRQLIEARNIHQENRQLRALLDMDDRLQLDDQGLVEARVYGRSPTVWYSTVQVDKGSSAGIAVDDPVVNGRALVGRVIRVTAGTATVTLITDPDSAVTAKIAPGGQQGVVEGQVGDPEDLILDFIDTAKLISRGDTIVTAGWRSEELGLDSLFPPNLPIGQVTEAPIDAQQASQQVHLRPFADLRSLDFVDVLTGGSRG
jgi:rod shape-determining protein MreC